VHYSDGSSCFAFSDFVHSWKQMSAVKWKQISVSSKCRTLCIAVETNWCIIAMPHLCLAEKINECSVVERNYVYYRDAALCALQWKQIGVSLQCRICALQRKQMSALQ